MAPIKGTFPNLQDIARRTQTKKIITIMTWIQNLIIMVNN